MPCRYVVMVWCIRVSFPPFFLPTPLPLKCRQLRCLSSGFKLKFKYGPFNPSECSLTLTVYPAILSSLQESSSHHGKSLILKTCLIYRVTEGGFQSRFIQAEADSSLPKTVLLSPRFIFSSLEISTFYVWSYVLEDSSDFMMHQRFSRCMRALPSLSPSSSAMQTPLAGTTVFICLALWQQPPGRVHLYLLQQFSLIWLSKLSWLAFRRLRFLVSSSHRVHVRYFTVQPS